MNLIRTSRHLKSTHHCILQLPAVKNAKNLTCAPNQNPSHSCVRLQAVTVTASENVFHATSWTFLTEQFDENLQELNQSSMA